MNALRCLRAVAPATPRPSVAQQARNMSLLSARRPLLSASSTPRTLAAPGAPSTALAAAAAPSTLDLVGKISASAAFAGTQIRCGPRDTYNPSHIVRKRRHGFLSRLRTKKGRKLLMRRLVKGRVNLSH